MRVHQLIPLLILCSCPASAVERWRMQYFHDVEREETQFTAIGFCSAQRGLATGVRMAGRTTKPIAIVTSNGGNTWTSRDIDEPGHAIHFFDETSGWMLTESGIWFSDECGLSWRRVHKQRGLLEIKFTTRERGWAIGGNKTALETSDRGKTWTKVKEVANLDLTPERTSLNAIDFATPQIGIMAGGSKMPSNHRLPLWLDPEPQSRKEKPAISVTMETRDGGATWSTNKVSMFGRISRIGFAADGRGLALIEFDDYFAFPSELYVLHAKGSSTTGRVLRREDLAVTDIFPGTFFYVAGFRPPGRVFRSPIPGKVRIARSADFKEWVESEVDYRAVARRVMLAGAGGKLWAATDTGMILNLVQE